jgi:hypothetical protein
MINIIGTCFQTFDDETLFLIFRAYITPPMARFTDLEAIRLHGYETFVRNTMSSAPDFKISRAIAAAVDKEDASALREVLFTFRSIELHTNVAGFMCILYKISAAAIAHRLVDDIVPLRNSSQSSKKDEENMRINI